MKKLTKEQQAEWTKMREDIEHHINTLNQLLADAEQFRDDRVSEMRDYFDNKSEKWQEGDAGQNYSAWIDSWDNLSFDQVDESELDEAPLEVEG